MYNLHVCSFSNLLKVRVTAVSVCVSLKKICGIDLSYGRQMLVSEDGHRKSEGFTGCLGAQILHSFSCD